MSDNSSRLLASSFRSPPSERDCFIWSRILSRIAAICGGGRATASAIKFPFTALCGVACFILYSISASSPALAELSCTKEVTGAANPPVQADDNFACLKKAITVLQVENEKIQKQLSTTPRVEVGTCSYAGHDLWNCSAGCANDETAVGGWCGNMDGIEVSTDGFFIQGHKTFVCALRQISKNIPPTLISVSAVCLRPHS